MIYTKLTKRALQIAYEAHQGQVDKSGLPYIYHPVHLAEQMDNEDEVCVALLHDVIEDTEVTSDDLRLEGFSENVINAIVMMTHDDSTSYMDYVAKIKGNPLAVKVKIADLQHNSNLSRLDEVKAKDLKRNEKYKKAIELLKS
jgi:(p)ppGpp synthase/HD superfamily hydrolase